jgi:hypothetical protein
VLDDHHVLGAIGPVGDASPRASSTRSRPS